MEASLESIEEVVLADTSEASEAERADAPGAAVRRRSGRGGREGLRARVRSLEQQRRGLLLTVAAAIVALVGVGWWGADVARERNRLWIVVNGAGAERADLEQALDASQLALAESRRTVEVLVSERIPGLVPIPEAGAVPVDRPLVREVAFTPIEGGVEVKLVVENDTGRRVSPALAVALFDRVGVELSRVTVVDGKEWLRPGEVRSFFAPLRVGPEGEPRYFRVTGG